MKFPARHSGISMLEVMLAITILAIVMLTLAGGLSRINHQNVEVKNEVFASQKAMQMMSELRGLVENNRQASIDLLDTYEDGTFYKSVLTTKKEVTDPADYLSENGPLIYCRRVNIATLPNEPNARRVSVYVYLTSTKDALASVTSVIRLDNTNATTGAQVFDVFILGLENVYGDTTNPATFRPAFNTIAQELQSKNPGLELRVHWLSRLSYGRDPYYTPAVNKATRTNDVVMPGVYFYPGLTNANSDFMYYSPDDMGGRIKVDGVLTNAASYSMADQYNNAVRYPDEVNLYNDAVAAAIAAGKTPPEMSWRMFLEKINSSTGGLDNFMLINIHGEVLPMPPIRNYSDAAKDPQDNPNVRVVTHPEKIQYNSGSGVNLRVYSYVMNPGGWGTTATISTITVCLTTAHLDASDITIKKLSGNDSVAYGWGNANVGTDYTITNPNASQTLITIYNSPLRHPQNGEQGLSNLNPTARLYGLEYIPCLVDSVSGDFEENNRDLAWHDVTVSTRPRNTARWVIRIAANAMNDGEHAIETRIGSDLTSGTAANKPSNLSRTYVWVGRTPPETERYQFTGDPRHMPYADVKANEGYNWFFRNITNANYPGFTKAVSGWDGMITSDVPRFYRLLRNGWIRRHGLFNNSTGHDNWYTGIGGEFGGEQSLEFIETPWYPDDDDEAGVSEVEDFGDYRRARVIASYDKSWQGLFWLGELYPDSAFATWSTTGNLPIGPAGFRRVNYNDFSSGAFKGFPYNPEKTTKYKGCCAFFNGNAAGSGDLVFQHTDNDQNEANLTSVGTTMAQDLNLLLPATLVAWRPYRLDRSYANPPEWDISPYDAERTRLGGGSGSIIEEYYTSAETAVGMFSIRLGTDQGYAVMNGLASQATLGGALLAKLSFAAVLRSFWAAGGPSVTMTRVPQLPLLQLSSPTAGDYNAPDALSVAWSVLWKRWDGHAYTENYANNFAETTPLTVNVKYSSDLGKTWHFAQDGNTASVGAVDSSHATTTPFTWDTSDLPTGSYFLRLEAYRTSIKLHYSYQQVQVNIKR